MDLCNTYAIKIGRAEITQGILKQAQPKLTAFGIELVDVKIKRINYVEQARKSVYGRMIAERKQIAEKFRSEGKGESRKIKGKADAKATAIFADAFGIDPEFYSFTKTLEIYNEALDTGTELILSTDSEFFKYLKGYSENP